MKPKIAIVMTVALILPVVAAAQVDFFGKPDTVFADVGKIDANNWTVTISYANDEWVEALSLPFHLDAGDNRIVGDSAVYAGGRVEKFDFKGFRADTAIQCITMGLMANMGPTHTGLAPGSGRLVTVFVSSLDDKPIEQLKVDTTTTHPSNSLMIMAQHIQLTEPPDTIPVNNLDTLRIVPTFIVRQAK